ncbi:MAG: response regulator [Pleurocapsa sp. SU_5_0]|nr:response regulator [Pleurocapsa sp. SU_5_0]NJO95813.1 response regulator [Pleurocapsa sp. CRU_1_2]
MTNNNPDRSPLILIVDDDRMMRSLLNLAMTEEGYRVAEAENGGQCLSEYTHFHPDLILLDAVMPDIDGFSCCQKIRSLPGGDRLPILMITVLNDQESVEQAFNAGATDYITKPIHWSVLSQRVRHLLAINQVWLELAAIKEKFQQQRNWEELMRKILQQLTQDNHVTDSIQPVLNTIRQWIQASRVLLYQADRQNYLESVAVGCPLIKDFSIIGVNLMAEYGEQYQQGKTIVIEDISQANLSLALIEQFKQLNTKALCIVPLKKNNQLGLLGIHFSKVFPQDQLLLNRLSDLGKLLAIAIL